MSMFWLIRYTLLLLLMREAATSNQITYQWRLSSNPEHYSIGFRLKDSRVIEELTGYSATMVTQCAMVCLKYQLCRSFNFSPSLRICQINAEAHDSYDPDTDAGPELDTDEDFTYYTREAFLPEVRLICCWYYSYKHVQSQYWSTS